MTTASVLGSFGGILNLYIGITFFAFVELLELLYKFIVTCIRRRKTRLNAGVAS